MMLNDLDESLSMALELHKSGSLDEAAKCYHNILNNYPNQTISLHNLGLIFIKNGKFLDAISNFETALLYEVNNKQYWKSYIETLIHVNELQKARCLLIASKNFIDHDNDFLFLTSKIDQNANLNGSHEPDNSLDYRSKKIRDIVMLLNQGEFLDAYDCSVKLRQLHSKSPLLNNILGLIAYKLGKFQEAKSHYNEALSMRFNYPEAHINLAILLIRDKDYAEAIKCLLRSLLFNPINTIALSNLGICFQKMRQFNKAILYFKKAVEIDSGFFDAFVNLGNTYRITSKYSDALKAYSRAQRLQPHNPQLLNNIALVYKDLGDFKTSERLLKDAIRFEQAPVNAWSNLGLVYKAQGQISEAISAFQNSINLENGNVDVHLNLSQINNYEVDSEHLKQMEDLILTDLSIDQRSQLFYALGTAYDKLKRYDKAFQYLHQGGQLRKKLLGYKVSDDIKIFQKIVKASDLVNATEVKYHSMSRVTPIFIVGMPRSGSTLVEQILTMDKDVFGGGELDWVVRLAERRMLQKNTISSEFLSDFRERYLTLAQSSIGSCNYITDKMPHNFLYVPLILKSLPEAKVVHVNRSAEATCWSNFKHYFKTSNLGYSYDLKDTVSHYVKYKEMMGHWNKLYSERIIQLNYEDLVEDPDLIIRSLISRIGLEWSDRFLTPNKNSRIAQTASQLQVRKAIYGGSSSNWKNYEKHLQHYFEVLRQY